jgi:hypothetical protein
MVTIDAVRAVAQRLPRSYEVIVRGRVKFCVGQIVWLAFSLDETVMGLASPKEERDWLIGASPDKFMLPDRSDLRLDWVHARRTRLPPLADARPRVRRLPTVQSENLT